MTDSNSPNPSRPQFDKVKAFERELDDVMEITDTDILKRKLRETENSFQQEPSELHAVRVAITWHEVALNLSFFSKTGFQGYAQKSYDLLTKLFNDSKTTASLMPFIASYRASSLALVGAETKKLKWIRQAFSLFADAVAKYADVSYLPEFLRGSVAENLPWFFFSKRKLAIKDFESIINKQEKDAQYANPKVMSFTYWAWAKQHQQERYRSRALQYLDKAISLDPNYEGGRERAGKLKEKLLKEG